MYKQSRVNMDDYTEKIGYYLQMLKRFSYPVSQRLGQLFLSQVLHFSMCVKKSSPLHSNNGPPLSSAQSVFLTRLPRLQTALHCSHGDH